MKIWALDVLADAAEDLAGLSLDHRDAPRAQTLLMPMARREGFHSVEELIRAAREQGDRRLARMAAEALLPPAPTFFHEPETLRRLCDEDLPAMAAARKAPLRVWVAGCGTGQEAYSLAMALEDAPGGGEVDIMATDMGDARLTRAEAGVYSAREVQLGLPAARLVRCFEKADGQYAISLRLRRRISWSRADLRDPPQRLGQFDAILCRNALGACLPTAREAIVNALARHLRPGGLLLLGARDEAPAGPWRVEGAGRLRRVGGVALAA